MKKYVDGVWLPASLLSGDALPVATRAYLLMLFQGHGDPGYWLRHRASRQAVRIGLPADESGRRAWQRAKDGLRSRGLLERRIVDAGGRILVAVEDPDPSPAALAAWGRVFHEYRAIPPGGFAPGRHAAENARRTAFRSECRGSEAARIAAALDALSWTHDDVERRYCPGWQRSLFEAMDRLAIARMPDVVVHGLPWAGVPGLEGMADLGDLDTVGFWGIQFPKAAAANPCLRDVPEGTRNQILLLSALNKATAKVMDGTWAKVAKPVGLFATLIAEIGTDDRDGLLSAAQATDFMDRIPDARPLSEWVGIPGDQRPSDPPDEIGSPNDDADEREVGRDFDTTG